MTDYTHSFLMTRTSELNKSDDPGGRHLAEKGNECNYSSIFRSAVCFSSRATRQTACFSSVIHRFRFPHRAAAVAGFYGDGSGGPSLRACHCLSCVQPLVCGGVCFSSTSFCSSLVTCQPDECGATPVACVRLRQRRQNLITLFQRAVWDFYSVLIRKDTHLMGNSIMWFIHFHLFCKCGLKARLKGINDDVMATGSCEFNG